MRRSETSCAFAPESFPELCQQPAFSHILRNCVLSLGKWCQCSSQTLCQFIAYVFPPTGIFWTTLNTAPRMDENCKCSFGMEYSYVIIQHHDVPPSTILVIWPWSPLLKWYYRISGCSEKSEKNDEEMGEKSHIKKDRKVWGCFWSWRMCKSNKIILINYGRIINCFNQELFFSF